jgi:histidinol phosphatase-like enzyme (inositol monophosphatase family)
VDARPSSEVQARLEFARRAAVEAASVIMAHFSGCEDGVRFQVKPDGSPVTAADTGAEEMVRGLIGRAWPADGVIGEECGAADGLSDYRWVIDPIDGTKSFIHGVPLFGTLIGVQHRQGTGGPWRSVAGVANFPALAECAWAAVGSGAWHSRGGGPPTRARVSTISRLAEATISVTSPRSMLERAASFYTRLNAACKLSRGWSDCYGTLLVATGRIEVMLDPPMKLWDVAALEPIIAEAGGKLTGWDGAPTEGPTGAIASNGWVHGEVLALRGG